MSHSGILVVATSPVLRDFLQRTLHARFPSLKVSSADSVREALQRIRGARPGFILMDVRLRDGCSFELTRHLRRMSLDAKVVFLSDCDLPEYREEAYRSGADHYLEKGLVSLDEIVALAQTAVAAGDKP